MGDGGPDGGSCGKGPVGGFVGLGRAVDTVLSGDKDKGRVLSDLKGIAWKLLRFSTGAKELELVRVRSESSTTGSKLLTMESKWTLDDVDR